MEKKKYVKPQLKTIKILSKNAVLGICHSSLICGLLSLVFLQASSGWLPSQNSKPEYFCLSFNWQKRSKADVQWKASLVLKE